MGSWPQLVSLKVVMLTPARIGAAREEMGVWSGGGIAKAVLAYRTSMMKRTAEIENMVDRLNW